MTLALILCLAFAGCQKAQETADDLEDLTSSESSITNPTSKELEAVKTPCDDMENQQDAEKCAKMEFDKSDAELNTLYQKLLSNLQNFEQKARPQDKVLADKYRKDGENLQTAQKFWLVYREANCLAEKELETNDGNNITAFSCQQRLTENRTEDLKLLYENK